LFASDFEGQIAYCQYLWRFVSLSGKLRAAFNPSNVWNVVAIEPDRIQTRYHDDGAPAWFATFKRI
jgi:hypothetical protein